MSRRALIVHASSLLERGFATTSPTRFSAQGTPTNALFVLTKAIEQARAFKKADWAVAVLDADTDADNVNDNVNDTTKKWPPELKSQAQRMAEIFTALGFEIVETVEGDAISMVASYVSAAKQRGYDVVVVGSDKRLAQLVANDVWWYDAYKDVRYTPELVRKRFDVAPAKVAGWLALVGDDLTLPGVKGIGKKGAAQLIQEYGSIAAALEVSDDVGGRAGKILRSLAAEVEQQLTRASLRTDVALPVAIDQLSYRPADTSLAQKLYAELGFFELLVASDADQSEVTICKTKAAVVKALACLKGGLKDRSVAIHVLCEDPSPARGALAGLALTQGSQVFYIPFRCSDNEHCEPDILAPFLASPSPAKVGHDIKAAALAFARVGIELQSIVFDSCCASHLDEPSNRAPHDLELVAKQALRRAIPQQQQFRGVGRQRKPWAKIPAARAAAYAGACVVAAFDACEVFEAKTDRTQMDEYLDLSMILVRMEQAGIACDAADLTHAGNDFEKMGDELENQIFSLAGKSFNLGSTKQLGSVLFEDLGLPVVKKTKTGWSTATAALERIEHAHPVVALVIRWRRLKRLRDSWATALRAAIDSDGRIHSTVHPARSFSGRLINQAPDLGRVPGRTPEMQRIRHAFAAPAGSVLLSIDYRQLGLYVLAHLTRDPALVEPLRRGDDLHRITASAVLELPLKQVSKDQRQLGKIINFATFAGQGASALSMQLGLSADEAKTLIERFNARYAMVRQFQEQQLRLARECGAIKTLAGRRWPIGGLGSRDQMERAYAERLARRATHEGSVADVSRRGLLRADQALRDAGLKAFPLLQVHDEVLFEVPEEELVRVVRVAGEAMATAFDLEVPLQVGYKAGPNWAQLELLEPS